MRRSLTAGLALAVALAACGAAQAQVTVFLDFTADANSNTIADWIEGLDAATTTAGVANFSGAERATIESTILSELNTMYANYTVNFVTTAPGSGSFHRVDFGATIGDTTTFGNAPLDFRNLFANDVINMFTHNFGPFIESAEPRAQQISEISIGLGGTAAHELGHAFGLPHQAAYGDPAITPANYANTGGVQNTHIMATGSTGLTEAQREVTRNFSNWSNVLLEAATGLTPSPLPLTAEAGDAGDTTGTAQAVATTSLSISQTDALLVQGRLNGAADVDVYSFTADGPGSVSAELWSDRRFVDDFNGLLELIDTDGVTVLASNDDVFYLNNQFDGGTFRDFDSFLLNIPLLSGGTYFFRVSNVGAIGAAADDGGFYNLIAAATVIPEPSSVLLVGVGLFGFAGSWLRRRRRRSA